MKKPVLAALITVIALAGCDEIAASADPGDGPITRVVKATRAACGYVPNEGTVEALLFALGGLESVATTGVAGRICGGLEAHKAEIDAALAACGTCIPPPRPSLEITDPSTGQTEILSVYEFEVDGVKISGGEVVQ